MKEQIQGFLNYLKYQKNFSFHTLAAYKNDLEGFSGFVKEKDIQEISKENIRAYIAVLSDQSFQAKTIRRKISAIRSFYKFLIKENLCSDNPCVGLILPKVKKSIPEFLNPEALLSYFEKETKEEEENVFEAIRNKLIIDILYQTGIRRSELVHLKWEDIDMYNLTIKVSGKRNKERIIPFSLNLKSNLERYFIVLEKKGLMKGYLLVNEKGKALSGFQVYYIVKKELYKITTQKKKHPHILRHSFATHTLNNGADINAIKEILGHSNLKATEIYTHNNIEHLKKIYKQSHPRSGE